MSVHALRPDTSSEQGGSQPLADGPALGLGSLRTGATKTQQELRDVMSLPFMYKICVIYFPGDGKLHSYLKGDDLALTENVPIKKDFMHVKVCDNENILLFMSRMDS